MSLCFVSLSQNPKSSFQKIKSEYTESIPFQGKLFSFLKTMSPKKLTIQATQSLLPDNQSFKMFETFRPEKNMIYQICPANRQDLCLIVGTSLQNYGRAYLSYNTHSEESLFAITYDSYRKTSKLCVLMKNEPVCLTIRTFQKGTYLTFKQISGQKTEDWQINKVETGFYAKDEFAFTIKNENGFYLDIENQKADRNKRAMIWSRDELLSQIWRLVPISTPK